ncbi:sulfate reduction electron transfer complex DsrMKJOP subunit DsrJ [bacterium]|nr:sulfate reduction electron transfer complex DsrMKJOP subunit DsrJ [bacterium]
MYDSGKVIIGVLVFLALLLFPVWYNLASGEATTQGPELAKPVKGEACVLETAYMRSNHMDLLDDWRERVVRNGERIFAAPDGQHFEMSLTNTCLDCHADKEKFCDECHTFMAVDPYCWDCHIVPETPTRQEVTYVN